MCACLAFSEYILLSIIVLFDILMSFYFHELVIMVMDSGS